MSASGDIAIVPVSRALFPTEDYRYIIAVKSFPESMRAESSAYHRQQLR